MRTGTDINDEAVTEDKGAWDTGNGVLRVLHMVRVDDIEFIYYDIERALQKLSEEPTATLEPITVH